MTGLERPASAQTREVRAGTHLAVPKKPPGPRNTRPHPQPLRPSALTLRPQRSPSRPLQSPLSSAPPPPKSVGCVRARTRPFPQPLQAPGKPAATCAPLGPKTGEQAGTHPAALTTSPRPRPPARTTKQPQHPCTNPQAQRAQKRPHKAARSAKPLTNPESREAKPLISNKTQNLPLCYTPLCNAALTPMGRRAARPSAPRQTSTTRAANSRSSPRQTA